jgi:hypothetical protein
MRAARRHEDLAPFCVDESARADDGGLFEIGLRRGQCAGLLRCATLATPNALQQRHAPAHRRTGHDQAALAAAGAAIA